MSSEVEICNLALSALGAGSINNLNESSLQAQQCKLHYNNVRDMLLTDHDWQFATKIRELALLTDEVFNWTFVYQYPSDCLKIQTTIANVETVDQNGTGLVARYRFEPSYIPEIESPVYEVMLVGDNQVIVSNHSGLRVKYTARITDPNKFSMHFKLALAHLLASQIAIVICGVKDGTALRSQSLTQYTYYKEKAVVIDLNQQKDDQPESEFITVRK